MFGWKDKFKYTLLEEFRSLLHQVSHRKHLVLKGRHVDIIILTIVDTFEKLKDFEVK